MPTSISFPTFRLGKKNRGDTIASNIQFPPPPWEKLLDEHDQLLKELKESDQIFMNRHRETVRESKRWKEAHGEVTQELEDTKMELASTKRRMRALQQQQVMLSSSTSRNSKTKESNNEKRCPTALPIVLRNAETRNDDNCNVERDDASDLSQCEHDATSPEDADKRNRKQQVLQELTANMDSYQVILRWQERQTDQWKSRCNRQLNQIEGLLAQVEQQKTELEHEKEQCDVLIDAVYQLVNKQQENEPSCVVEEDDDETEDKKVEDSTTHKDGSILPALPDDCFCPLTQQLFVDPVIDYEGNTYEKKAIMEWLECNQTSPLTRNDLTKDQLIPNRAVKHAIAAWKQR